MLPKILSVFSVTRVTSLFSSQPSRFDTPAIFLENGRISEVRNCAVCFSILLIPLSEDRVKIKVKVHPRTGHDDPE
jgi:hypothetical protein